MSKPVTLRSLGFSGCEHQFSWGENRRDHNCMMCNAKRLGQDTFEGGSIDYPLSREAQLILESAMRRHGDLLDENMEYSEPRHDDVGLN